MAKSVAFFFLFALTLSSHVLQSSAFQTSGRLALNPRAKGPAMTVRRSTLNSEPLVMGMQPADRIKSAAFGLLLAAGLAFGAPGDALAAKSGARMGGGSFKTAPAPRAAPSRPSVSQSYGGSTVMVAPPPVMVSPSPFGYSPMVSPFGFSPFGFFRPVVMGPSITDILLLGGIAFAGLKIYEGVQNAKLGGGAGVTVAKLQVAVSCDSRGPSSLLGTLGRLAETADTSTQTGVSELVSDVALALLRKEVDWISAAVDSAKASGPEDGETKFGQFSLKERAKIERETVNKVGGKDKSEARGKEEGVDSFGTSTVAVVTLILALQNRPVPEVTDLKTLKELLMTLGSDVLDNESLMAAEVMWTPEEPWDRLTNDQVTLDYPNLIPL
mmetsp:Transcript_7020/g.13970  ORF Transcript_7020/g.13970 Transcript_7020/m.13970 type:complete len:384 (+) Transcript_7020:56-1207(+)|eukprot:CAMPEP_0181337858 /NCGR_PEP_ID=MMETSP1101-20121128/28285_1 /TAXON_ID=46948 /ORGANISM="Rhodomonas abbreviata, Strain Caron Lab Isolate" /LENGTH=383 /DNA_ID=CAMNT_0023448465 /DNA_START=51 /DNA_END=1202 /DNA_ORIENTATION=-